MRPQHSRIQSDRVQRASAYAGAMLNINTFNQPGVEEGKKATFALLGKAGYAEKKKELDSLPAKNPACII